MAQYKIGMQVRGKITGIQPYGAFVSLDDKHQGLIHISECKYGYVGDIDKILTIGQTVDVLVLDIDEFTKKISLSLRSLQTKNSISAKRMDESRIHKHYWTSRNITIGFSPIATRLDTWIDEGLKRTIN